MILPVWPGARQQLKQKSPIWIPGVCTTMLHDLHHSILHDYSLMKVNQVAAFLVNRLDKKPPRLADNKHSALKDKQNVRTQP